MAGRDLYLDDNSRSALVGSTFDSGETATVTPGTPVILLPASTETLSVAILADADNRDIIHIGGSDVDWTANIGLKLSAGQGVTMDVDNSRKALYIDSETTAQKVSWIYLGGR